MPYIRQVPVEEATGFLKKLYDAAVTRAGRLWRISQAMSLNPKVMAASSQFYGAVMFGSSPISRRRREMLAVVTSKALGCFY